MVARQPERVGRRQGRQIGIWFVRPQLLRSGERGIESVLIASSDKSAVLANLIDMERVDRRSREPYRFGHGLLGELRERVPIALCDLPPAGDSTLGRFIVRRQQDAVRCLHCKYVVAGGEVQAINHLLWQRRADGLASPSKSNLLEDR